MNKQTYALAPEFQPAEELLFTGLDNRTGSAHHREWTLTVLYDWEGQSNPSGLWLQPF